MISKDIYLKKKDYDEIFENYERMFPPLYSYELYYFVFNDIFKSSRDISKLE